ncbi:MAG: hypothetical protein D6732_20375, partial [Methanobacteriota archaeon]
DIDISTVLDTFETLKNELEAYSSSLVEKPALVLLSKMDIWGESNLLSEITDKLPYPVLGVSSLTGEGLAQFKHQVWNLLEKANIEEITYQGED